MVTAMMFRPAVVVAALPAKVTAVVTVLLLDDDHLPRLRRSARHDRQSKSESGNGRKSKYDLSHAVLLWNEQQGNAPRREIVPDNSH